MMMMTTTMTKIMMIMVIICKNINNLYRQTASEGVKYIHLSLAKLIMTRN